MSKKIFEVGGSAIRDMRHKGSGSFFSTHKQEDIEKWLWSKEVQHSLCEFEDIFEMIFEWERYVHHIDEQIDEFEVSFLEREDLDEGEGEGWCKFDEEIQKFLDEESK